MSGKSIIKAFLIGLLALGGALATTPSILAQDAPPATEEAKAIENLVNRAATLIDKDGKAAFVEFRKKDSVWFHGDTYLFAYDMGANVLLNPAFPQREGTNVSGQKDSKGKLLHQAIIDTAKKGSGWVDYWFPKPGQTEPSHKWLVVNKPNCALIGSGRCAG